MRFYKYFILTIILASSAAVFAQRPERGGNRWFQDVDTNGSGAIETEEFRAAANRFFTEFDRNGDGTIDETERPRPPRPPREGRDGNFPPPMDGRQGPPPGGRPGMPPMSDGRPPRGEDGPPRAPFFVMESLKGRDDVTRAAYDQKINEQFALMDTDKNNSISLDEARRRSEEFRKDPKNPPPPPRDMMPPLDSPTARFIGAEMRFGDKFVKDTPFSAETVIEKTRRLYDGSTIVNQTKGAIYRDGAGRTRREQPLESIGGFSVVGENGSPQKLIFINDFPAKMQYFLDTNRKIARRNSLPDNRPPLDEPEIKNGKTESLGTKTIEGVSAEGTRTTFEIPAGQIGNDKPLAVVSERWFSPELQIVVMSRHLDPIAGEHVFKLVNIKKGEPSAELFSVPNDFKVSAPPKRPN